MHKFFLFLLILVQLNASTLRGLILNEFGDPISFPIIQVQNGGSYFIGNEYGEIGVSGTPGDSITLSRFGYETIILTLSTSDFTITLLRDPIQLDNIQVKTFKLFPLDQSRSFNTKDHFTGNISSLFNSVPSLQVRTYGGHAANATISIDGGPGSHTKVFFEGIDITSPQNGETDFSQIPPELIGAISTAIQPGLHYGSGTMDGILRLTKAKRNGFSIGMGSWDRLAWSAATAIDLLESSGSIIIGQRSSKDNYQVSWRGNAYRRDNNHFTQTYAASSMKKMIKEKWYVNSTLLYTDQERGIAGPIQSPSLNAERNDNLFIGALKTTYLIQNGFINLSLMTRQSHETYKDTDWNINSVHELSTNTINFSTKLNIRPGLAMLFKGQFIGEEINSSDTDYHKRENISSFLSVNYKLTPFLKWSPSVRYDLIDKDYSIFTFNVDLLWKQTLSVQHLFSFGNGFSPPTFNDMYWAPGGNPNLDPEISTKIMYMLTSGNKDSYLDLKIRHVDSENLIVWTSGENYWSPNNISSSSRSSISLSGNIYISQINFSGNLNRLWTRDHYHKKPLRYAPEWSGAVQIQRSFGLANIGLSGRFTGERISMYEYPEDKTLPPHFIPSFIVSQSYEIRKHTIELQFSSDNIINKNFETIDGYPEPTRSVYLSINIY